MAVIKLYNDTELLHWRLKHSQRLLDFKDKHQGQGCFIIGNGPSLNKMDLRPLRNHHTFGLNKIYLMFDKIDINLSYHVAVNPLVIHQSARDFESLACPSFLSYKAARGVVRNLRHIYFIATQAPDSYFSFYHDLTWPVHEGYTVTFVAMQIAFYMGFSKVYLVGVDHNFSAVGKPNEKQVLEGEDVDHFHPAYFANKEWHLPDLAASELAYQLARFFYNRNGRQIFDATLNGKLTIFPKVEYEQALKFCTKK